MKAYFKLLAAVLPLIVGLALKGAFRTFPQYESPQLPEGVGLALACSRYTSAEKSSTIAVDPDQREAILSATVRITLIAPRLDENGTPLLIMRDERLGPRLITREGLGTAVQYGKRRLIVTHDHWSQLTDHLLQVRIDDLDGHPLAIISGFVFHNTILYRDGDTLIFLAPEGVQSSAALMDGELLGTDGILLMVHVRPDNRDQDVVPVQVTEVNLSKGLKTIQFQLPSNEKVIRGNSGGGIWSNGDLVANLWSVTANFPL